jgi:N-acetylmuramoyl-L-alanine amidase
MSHTPDSAPRESGSGPKVVVRLRETRSPLVATAAPGGSPPNSSEALWQRVRSLYPGATIERSMAGVSAELIERGVREANAAGGRIPNLNNYYSISPPAGARAAELMAFMLSDANREQVETAYVDNGVIPATISPGDDPLFPGQTYVRGRRGNKRGIYANFAWGQPGGDGAGMGIVFVEMSWQLNHEDLVGAGITLISGVNGTSAGSKEHGTNVVGEVMGQDNNKGIVGVAPKARARVVSIERTAGNFNTAAAIWAGVFAMSPGDVMSISLQTGGGSVAAGGFRPIEINDLEFFAIRVGTALGRTICCAAGNAFIDLDAVTNSAGKFVLRRGHADFRDSGAILCGAGTDVRPHVRVSGPGHATNFGSRVDCFAQGVRVCTTSTTAPKYIPDFRNTSAATPIVAGAAVLTQGMAKARTGGTLLTTAQVRSVLSGPRTSIRSSNPSFDRIGRMPNLQLIHANFISTLRRPTASVPVHSAYAGRGPRVFIDAGHGGEERAGRSSAYGGRGVQGGCEKEIALDVARRAQTHFGRGATLSRDGDYNLSLQQRMAGARRSGAPAFVSVHAHSGATRHAGPEVWVYGDGSAAPSPHSMMLAENIRAEMAAAHGRPVRLREGRIAVLQPAYHGPDVAAVLVEAGSLSSPEDEERLGDPGATDTIGAAIARGVHSYIGTVATDGDDTSDTEDNQNFTSAAGLGQDGLDDGLDDYSTEPGPAGQDLGYGLEDGDGARNPDGYEAYQ